MTLLELVIVLAILSLAVSLVAPRFGNWSDEWTLRGAAERVAQTVRYAHTRALFEQSYTWWKSSRKRAWCGFSIPPPVFRGGLHFPGG